MPHHPDHIRVGGQFGGCRLAAFGRAAVIFHQQVDGMAGHIAAVGDGQFHPAHFVVTQRLGRAGNGLHRRHFDRVFGRYRDAPQRIFTAGNRFGHGFFGGGLGLFSCLFSRLSCRLSLFFTFLLTIGGGRSRAAATGCHQQSNDSQHGQ
ncbi:MAG: hypothetical protein FOGNACKC_05905 [Anaerolineae bacterium]|nr:hypothetical protein [Anaerolineae bacterium]